jgi:arylformamidase
VPAPDLDADTVGLLLVRHLGLLMVDRVEVSDLTFLAEPHKGTPGLAAAGARARRIVDLSHPIEDGMVTYPGLPGPRLREHLSREASRERYAAGTEFLIGEVTMVGNTGTYLDSPHHRYAGGTDLAGLPIERVTDLDGIVVRLTGSAARGVDIPALAARDVAGKAVLLHTGWDARWRTDSYGDAEHPYLTGAAARWLVEQGAALVGIDSVNIDDTTGDDRPAHSALLGAGIPVVEHLTALGELPADGFRFHAPPAPVRDFGTFPVRAYAILDPLEAPPV